MIGLLLASLFFTTPAPLDMPRAEAFHVETRAGRIFQEDRFSQTDLWVTQRVLGRWIDEAFRVFTLARLDALPPALGDDSVVTRTAAATLFVPADRKDPAHVKRMVAALSPVEVPEEPSRAETLPRGFRAVDYWQGTNTTALVCAFLPEASTCWYLAVWELAEEETVASVVALFESSFLRKKAYEEVLERCPPVVAPRPRASRKKAPAPSERDLLRRDARLSVAAYPQWHATDAPVFTVLDDLPSRAFVTAVTNDLDRAYRRFSAVFPSPLETTNTLCVARIYADREDYLEAAGESLAWTAAYWSPLRRELVAYWPPGGGLELLRTIRHEAFHQYLSYACGMLTAAPWINEGYAQYFEDENELTWGMPLDLETAETVLPAIFKMDYAAFYDGSPEQRRLHYRLARSVACFLEKGAPRVRFEPFKDLKKDYLAALLKTHDPQAATAAAFGSQDKFKLFVAEWKKFWRQNM